MRRAREDRCNALRFCTLPVPAAFALIVERWGYGAGEAVMLGAGLVAFLAMEAMALWYRGRHR